VWKSSSKFVHNRITRLEVTPSCRVFAFRGFRLPFPPFQALIPRFLLRNLHPDFLMQTVYVGILGLGTVGAGVAETLIRQRGLIAARSGIDLVLKKAVDLNLKRDFGFPIPTEILSTDANEVLNDPDIRIVVELIGGTGVARKLILAALAAGKSVVTANKALLAEHGPELIEAAADAGVDLFFEASVAGGIPIIKSLREGLVANSFNQICGILNGTCNYILTRMEKEGVAFDDVLKDAQRLGYAEAEPSLDIDGWDTAHKAVILAQLAFGVPVGLGDFPVRGIRGIDPIDVKNAAELGYRIKLLAILEQFDGKLEVGVQPTLIPEDHMLAGVDMSFNAVLVKGDIVGDTLYYGRGAGRLPTASAVVADVLDAARDLSIGASERIPLSWRADPAPRLVPPGERTARSYLRLNLRDRPGSLGNVARLLGEHNITITALVQKEEHQAHEFVPVVILTGEARMDDMHAAMDKLRTMEDVGGDIVRYRVEELG
jgi:homoserine dehydrogenase